MKKKLVLFLIVLIVFGASSILKLPVMAKSESTSLNSATVQDTLQYGLNGKFVAPIEEIASDEEWIAISNREGLEAIKENLNGNYYLTADVDLFEGGEQDWVPLGLSEENAFTGVFDGQGHVIRNLSIKDRVGREVYGLFGYIVNGMVRNVGLEDVYINADKTNYSPNIYAGSISGKNMGDIRNCYSTGEVVLDVHFHAYAGGITGANKGVVSDCYNAGKVSATSDATRFHSNVGGIAGAIEAGGVIELSYNVGEVSSFSYGENGSVAHAGGVSGSRVGTNIKVNDCYNVGSVTAFSTFSNAYAGGISGTAGAVNDSYNEGRVSAESERYDAHAGGIVGYLIGSIRNSYNIGIITGQSPMRDAYVGGISGRTSDSVIEHSYNTGNLFVTTGHAYLGSVSGRIASSTVEATYWNEESIQKINGVLREKEDKKGVGDGDDSIGTKLTDEQMKLSESYVDFNFDTVWTADSDVNNGYPVLRSLYSQIDVQTTGGGTTVGSGLFKHGTSATLTATANPGYTFAGWYDENNIEVSASPSYTFTVETDRTLEARFTINRYTVTVTAGVGGTVRGGNHYNHGTSASLTATANAAYIFDGWYENGRRISTAATYSFNVTTNRTLQARFKIRQYKVTFRNGTTTLSTQTVNHGQNAKAPTAPRRTGYRFSGWNRTFNNVTGNLVVSAKWAINRYRVTFKDGNRTVRTRNINHNKRVASYRPKKKGHTFIGWYTDRRFKTKYNFNRNVTGNRTLYARFVKNPAAPKKLKVSKGKAREAKINWQRKKGFTYEIQMSTSKRASSFKRVKTTKGKSYTRKRLARKKTYYVRIRSYRVVDKVKVYSKYTKIRRVKM